MGVVVEIFLFDFLVGDADFRAPGFLRRPFDVGQDDDGFEVVVDFDAKALGFGGRRRESFDIRRDCFAEID